MKRSRNEKEKSSVKKSKIHATIIKLSCSFASKCIITFDGRVFHSTVPMVVELEDGHLTLTERPDYDENKEDTGDRIKIGSMGIDVNNKVINIQTLGTRKIIVQNRDVTHAVKKILAKKESQCVYDIKSSSVLLEDIDTGKSAHLIISPKYLAKTFACFTYGDSRITIDQGFEKFNHIYLGSCDDSGIDVCRTVWVERLICAAFDWSVIDGPFVKKRCDLHASTAGRISVDVSTSCKIVKSSLKEGKIDTSIVPPPSEEEEEPDWTKEQLDAWENLPRLERRLK